MKDYMEAIRWRRSNYDLTAKIPMSDETLAALIQEVAEKSPSPFNMQAPRLVLLLGEAHKKHWEIVRKTLRGVVKDDKSFQATNEKIDGFAAGYGTILYLMDEKALKNVQEQIPTYADRFDLWAEHANGAVLFAEWAALAAHGIGASIQHYNPLIDEEVKQTFDLPAHWRLVGQMPFGIPASQPEPRPTFDQMLTVRK